jgi:PAS domain S-box-containing protein
VDLNGLLTNTADGVCAVNSDGKIVLWNRAADKILGYSAKKVIGRPCWDVFVGRDAAGNRLCYQGCHVMTLVSQGERIQHFDMATRTKAGKPVWLNISIVVVPGARRDLSTTIHLFRDVTVSHEIESLVRERVAQVKAGSAEAGGSPAELTRREREVLRLMTGGANTKAMAERLHISPATVRNHVQNIFGKLGVHNRLEAVAYATRHGFL